MMPAALAVHFRLASAFAVLSVLSACSAATEPPLVPTPEAILWQQPLSLGDPRGEVGDAVVFSTPLRRVNSRGAVVSGSTITVVDGPTGVLRWQYQSDSITGTTVPFALAARELYVDKGTGTGTTLSTSVLDAATGQIRWQAASCGTSPARIGQTLVVLEGSFSPTRRFAFVGHDATTGIERWRVDVTDENVHCFRALLLTIRNDTAVYLLNVAAPNPPFTPVLQFLHLSAAGTRRTVPFPPSLIADYTSGTNATDARMLGDRGVVLIRDSTRFTAVDISDGSILWSRDPRPTDVVRRSSSPRWGYQAIAATNDVVVVATGDSLGYPVWRGTLDAGTGLVTNSVRPGRTEVTPLGACGSASVLGWDDRRRLLLLDGTTQTIARRLDVTLGSTGNETLRPNAVEALTSAHKGRYGLVADLRSPFEPRQWLAFRCD